MDLRKFDCSSHDYIAKLSNRSFGHYQFDSKFICLYTFAYRSYFCVRAKWYLLDNGKHKQFEYNFLIICKYLNLVK